MEKTYQSSGNRVHFQLNLVDKQGKPKTINFTGGVNAPRRNSTFTTSDPDVIELMEATGSFGKAFRLVHTKNVAPPNIPQPRVEKQEVVRESNQLEYKIETRDVKPEQEVINEVEKDEIPMQVDVEKEPIMHEVKGNEPWSEKIIDGMTHVRGITTVQNAKNYLLQNINGLKVYKIRNWSLVEKVAKENNIYFPEMD